MINENMNTGPWKDFSIWSIHKSASQGIPMAALAIKIFIEASPIIINEKEAAYDNCMMNM